MKALKIFGATFFMALSIQMVHAKAAASKKGDVKVIYQKKTKYDFSGKDVDGQFLKPDGSAIRGDQDLTFDSLLTPRKNFSKELHRSSGAIR